MDYDYLDSYLCKLKDRIRNDEMNFNNWKKNREYLKRIQRSLVEEKTTSSEFEDKILCDELIKEIEFINKLMNKKIKEKKIGNIYME